VGTTAFGRPAKRSERPFRHFLSRQFPHTLRLLVASDIAFVAAKVGVARL